MGPGLVNHRYVASRGIDKTKIGEALILAGFNQDSVCNGVEDCGGLLKGDARVPTVRRDYHRAGFPRAARLTVREYIFGETYLVGERPNQKPFGLAHTVETNLPLDEAVEIIPKEKGEIPEQYLALMGVSSSSSG